MVNGIVAKPKPHLREKVIRKKHWYGPDHNQVSTSKGEGTKKGEMRQKAVPEGQGRPQGKWDGEGGLHVAHHRQPVAAASLPVCVCRCGRSVVG